MGAHRSCDSLLCGIADIELGDWQSMSVRVGGICWFVNFLGLEVERHRSGQDLQPFVDMCSAKQCGIDLPHPSTFSKSL